MGPQDSSGMACCLVVGVLLVSMVHGASVYQPQRYASVRCSDTGLDRTPDGSVHQGRPYEQLLLHPYLRLWNDMRRL